MIDPAKSPATVLSAFLDAMADLDPDRAITFFAEDGTFEFPYGLPGMPTRATGRSSVMKVLRGMSMFDWIELYDRCFYETDDPEMAVATFKSHAQAWGNPYANTYVSLARVRDGHIVEYQEHFEPLALIGALPAPQRLSLLAVLALPRTLRTRLFASRGFKK